MRRSLTGLMSKWPSCQSYPFWVLLYRVFGVDDLAICWWSTWKGPGRKGSGSWSSATRPSNNPALPTSPFAKRIIKRNPVHWGDISAQRSSEKSNCCSEIESLRRRLFSILYKSQCYGKLKCCTLFYLWDRVFIPSDIIFVWLCFLRCFLDRWVI